MQGPNIMNAINAAQDVMATLDAQGRVNLLAAYQRRADKLRTQHGFTLSAGQVAVTEVWLRGASEGLMGRTKGDDLATAVLLLDTADNMLGCVSGIVDGQKKVDAERAALRSVN